MKDAEQQPRKAKGKTGRRTESKDKDVASAAQSFADGRIIGQTSSSQTRNSPTAPLSINGKVPAAAYDATTSAAASSNDMDDFLARARALGLNLTRQDYERARAGVSAFLRAKRVSSKQDESPSEGNASPNAQATSITSEKKPEVHEIVKGRSGGLQPSTSHESLWQKNNPLNKTMLSFFTAVEETQDPEAKSRPRLDDFGALEERRRRKERRRRLREKAEREANDADCETGSHRRRKAASEPCEDSPSTCVGADDTPVLTSSCSFSAVASTSEHASRSKSLSLTSEALARVGLGISNELEKYSPSAHQSNFDAATFQRSPSLSKLTRKAHIDSAGRLLLLPSPAKDADAIMSDAEEALNLAMSSKGRPSDMRILIDDDEMIKANAGGETDDSGVCFLNETVGDAAKKPLSRDRSCPNDDPSSHRQRVSSLDSSTNSINDEIQKLSFLERIMAQKKSPLRLRREAKERDRQARLAAANHDLIVMTAIEPASRVENSAPVPQSSSALSLSAVGQSNAADANSAQQEQSKSVRWAGDLKSPRKRMTTKDIYDYEFYGIAPIQPASRAATSLHAWDTSDADVAARQLSGEIAADSTSNHSRARSNFSSTSFGSPVAVRNGAQQISASESPGFLSLSLQEGNSSAASNVPAMANPQLFAKRGLLFNVNNNPNALANSFFGPGAQTPPITSSFDSYIGDLSNVFSQGPTLARSPVRKGVVDTETPPRLLRATTLAAPISLSQQTSLREYDGKGSQVNSSPERSQLVRAHSFSVLERNNRLQSHPSFTQADDDKENHAPHPGSDAAQSSGGRKVPRGWAHYSPAGKGAATISPAAIFGMQGTLQQQVQQQQQQPQQPQKKGARAKQARQQEGMQALQRQERLRTISTGSASDAERRNGQHSASEAEGDDERDMSPIVMMHGRGNNAAGSDVHRSKKNSMGHRHARNGSFSTSSAYDESPLMLDTRSQKATIVVRPTSGSSLATALDMPNRPGVVVKQPLADLSNRTQNVNTDQTGPLRKSVNEGNHITPHLMEWDKPDGSRIVKLVSEELYAALENGTISEEPRSRFYRLPPAWGRSKSKPQSVSYAGMIGQAILSSSDGRLSLNEIYNWISSVFPFFERGDRGWQNSIRHNLSLNKSFIKIEREASVPGKGGWWAIKTGHEQRFRAGNYVAPGSNKAAAKEGSGKQCEAGWKSNELISDQKAMEGPGQIRRKRLEADAVDAGESQSGSDASVTRDGLSKGARKRSKKARDVGSEAVKPMPVTLLKPEDNASLLSPSSKHVGTITPSRPYQPGGATGIASSEMGSAYTSSIMAGMPVLTDASSPPSSPHHSMPPPAGGIRGAASTQSAQKQTHPSSMLMSYAQGGMPFGSMNFANAFQHHAMPASPLAHMRTSTNGGTHGGGTTLRTGVNLANATGMESPLRHTDASMTRMLVNSPPVSNVRETDGTEKQGNEDLLHNNLQQQQQQQRASRSLGVNRSPARFLNHSPVRGSPLRPGGALNMQSQAASVNTMSPASSQLQIALGQQQQGQMSNGPQSYTLMAGTSTPITARWSFASPSPARRMDGLFSPGQHTFGTPNVHGHAVSATTPGGLDDPFDYSGNLQHEFDITNELNFTHQGEPSPMKGFEHHAFGHRSGIANDISFGTANANLAQSTTVPTSTAMSSSAPAQQSHTNGNANATAQSISSSFGAYLPAQ